MIKNIVVIGGGTAGWLTALMAKKTFPENNVTVIESEELGILGAGEGTTPNFIALLNYLEIPLSKLISCTNTTLKNGIKFTNWKNDSNYYYHNFNVINPSLLESNFNHAGNWNKHNTFNFLNVFKDVPLKDFELISMLNEQNKSPHFLIPYFDSTVDPILLFNNVSSFAIHFDAKQLANLLKDISLERGITRIEGKVIEVKSTSNGDICSVKLENNQIVLLDFVFDCSGFFRLLIGKHFNSKWKSHLDKLPVNSAIPFFLPPADVTNLPPYTESIAMNYGWMWKIPLQHRFGCGYVYDSNLLTEDNAIKELEEYLGFEPQYPRQQKGSFKFNAGYYETTWVNNCISLGLSSGFIEPLEATSLMLTVSCLQEIFSDKLFIENKNQKLINKYNTWVNTQNQEICDFIYLHYMSTRTDTDFWKHFTFKNASDSLKEKIEFWDTLAFKNTNELYMSLIFSKESWFIIGLGVGLINTSKIKEFVIKNELSKYLNKHEVFKLNQSNQVNNCLNHGEFLKKLGATFEN